MVLGTPPARTSYFFRRRSKLLAHKAPHAKSPLPRDALDIGRTVMLPIEWSPRGAGQVATPPIKIGATTVTELFRKECELPGYVRSVHAVEALSSANQIAKYEVGDSTVLLATRRITLSAEPYTLLILAAQRVAGQTEIYLGLRVYYDSEYNGDDVTPWKAFEVLLKRHGLPVSVGSQSGLFIPAVRVEAAEGDSVSIVRGAAPDNEPFLIHAMVRRDSAGFTDVSWAFALLTERYRADLRRHQR